MASVPATPDREHPVIAFDGAISTQVIHNTDRAFLAEVVFRLQHPKLLELGSQKPPLHFHPYQAEYIEVLEGRLSVEVEGKEYMLTKGNGEFCVKPWSHHRLYPPPNDGSEITRFLLSGADTHEEFRLDNLFFSNWYGYQDNIFCHGKRFHLIQVMSMFDAGGSYLSLPWWIPFGRMLSMALSILIGRWMGALMGYQPYYQKWSVDWDLACTRMETSIFQRRFADRNKRE